QGILAKYRVRQVPQSGGSGSGSVTERYAGPRGRLCGARSDLGPVVAFKGILGREAGCEQAMNRRRFLSVAVAAGSTMALPGATGRLPIRKAILIEMLPPALS